MVTPGGGAEWDAPTYHRLSEPQVAWGRTVLGQLDLTGDERVIDAGCGTGRLTADLLERLPRGRVLAIDQSANMLTTASRHLSARFGQRIIFLQADLKTLALREWADVMFSTAALHWVVQHPRLFRNLRAAVHRGGRLHAQCGGGPNLARLLARTSVLMMNPDFAPYFRDWRDPWEFPGPAITAERLRDAGWTDVETSLEPAPVTLASADEFRDFLSCVVVRFHLERLPAGQRLAFASTLAEQSAADDPPFSLDYWRLNLRARRE